MAGISSVGASVGAYVPVQRLQAERAAAQAEGRAQRLAAESQQARDQADGLLQRADRLRGASAQAQSEASNARRSGQNSPSVAQVGQPVAAAVPNELRQPEPPQPSPRAAVAGPATVSESVSSINLYLQVGAASSPASTIPAAGPTAGGPSSAALGATLNVSA